MNNIIYLVTGTIGLLLLYYGADWLVSGGTALAVRCRISPLVIGLTLIAFGTSAPEFFVSTWAALDGLGDICVGNIVGSNICNIALILGVSALVMPLSVSGSLLRRDIPIMIVSAMAVTLLICRFGGMTRLIGLVFLAGLFAYTAWGIVSARSDGAATVATSAGNWPRISLLTVGGFAALIVGAKLLLSAAVGVERMFGIPDEVVALTVVAVGTSLPELATSVVAARRGEADIAIGNVVGSNIFNILGILGFSAAIAPFRSDGVNAVDYGMMLMVSVLLWLLVGMRRRLDKLDGILLLIIYVAYVAWLYVTIPVD